MKYSIDISTRVSPELSAVVEKLASDPYREPPATLGHVLRTLRNRVEGSARNPDPARARRIAAMIDEVEALIEEFGAEADAGDFVATKASEGLSRIIEYATAGPVARRTPTLGVVRDAMAGGLTAQLVGDGTLDPDEDQTLLAEIDALIARHGQDAMAEEFVRFE